MNMLIIAMKNVKYPIDSFKIYLFLKKKFNLHNKI